MLTKRVSEHNINYDKVRFEEQSPESLILDDMLLSIMLYGLKSLKNTNSYEEYYKKLCLKFLDLSVHYLDILEESNKKFNRLSKRLKQDAIYLINPSEETLDGPKQAFEFIKSMTSIEFEETQSMLFNLFVYKIDHSTYMDNVSKQDDLFLNPYDQKIFKKIIEDKENTEKLKDYYFEDGPFHHTTYSFEASLQELQVERNYYYINAEIMTLVISSTNLPNLIDDFDDFLIFIKS